jgi:Tol biopolymer transport system component
MGARHGNGGLCNSGTRSSAGAHLAAIVAPSFGNWTVAVNGTPWRSTFNELVADAVFSPDGKRVAAIGKQNGSYRIIVDDSVWPQTFDMAWAPVFSPDGRQAAAKVEKKGKFTFSIDGRLWNGQADAAWAPVFSPDGRKILFRTIENGSYVRRVLSVSDIAG